MLAMHPDEQDKLYESIKGVLRDGRLPEYEDFNSLSYCEACVSAHRLSFAVKCS